MNRVLELKGRFNSRKNPNRLGPVNLPKDARVTLQDLNYLKANLEQVLKYWEKRYTVIGGTLVSVHYKKIIAKSNRLKTLLSEGTLSPNESIRGAKFVWDPLPNGAYKQKHVFTHFVSLKAIHDSINTIDKTILTMQLLFGGVITTNNIEEIHAGNYDKRYIHKTKFLYTIVDAYYVEKFMVDEETKEINNQSIVTLYKTGKDTKKILGELGIYVVNAKMIDETTLRLNPYEIKIIQENMPYLIAMDVADLSKMIKENIIPIKESEEVLSIPKPESQPIIGVIDTQFDENVYFHEWVDYKNELSSDFEITSEDRFHGTTVTSIVVDGPAFNPELDDGCGRFRVKHFGVALAGSFSSFTILKKIREIVIMNRDIKVWNLSLGSEMEISDNFISPESAELDKIQSEYDVIFIVAGTNKKDTNKHPYKIGAPADSLNSIVVNSVNFDGESASYTRVGPVLSFFHKPDVSYYGGDGPNKIIVCEPLGKAYVCGTSYATPWITRKIAYLIHIIGLNREIAKALIIDSAANWNRKDDDSFSIGYGVVPIHIKDILHSKDDEIRFIMSGTIDEYETYTYNIPVPKNKDKHPFFAKATLVYFPNSDRNQGVDYTNTEMDIHFGRIHDRKGIAAIKSINSNEQAEDGINVIYEEDARTLYRKWDNVKHINEVLNPRAKPRKAYESGMWGLSIKVKERLKPKEGRGLRFGVVITLKEMNGVNRVDEFIRMCLVRGWIVNEIDVDNQIDIYLKSQEDIEFE